MIEPTARDAWIELESKLRPFVVRRVRSLADVDDVLQEVLLRLHKGLSGLRDEQRFGPWAYQVARNTIADHYKRAHRHEVDGADVPEHESTEGDDENTVESMVAAYVGGLVATLPSPYREALTLTELEGVSQREASEMLGVSVTCLKSRVQRGREKLRQAFEACCAIALDARGRVLSCEPKLTGPMPNCACDTDKSRH